MESLLLPTAMEEGQQVAAWVLDVLVEREWVELLLLDAGRTVEVCCCWTESVLLMGCCLLQPAAWTAARCLLPSVLRRNSNC